MLMIWSALCTEQSRAGSQPQLFSALRLINTGACLGRPRPMRTQRPTALARAPSTPRLMKGAGWVGGTAVGMGAALEPVEGGVSMGVEGVG